jgi:hypothetical protein
MSAKRFMVIETFRCGDPEPVYARFHAKGRMLPDGLLYVDSWLAADGQRCFQLMETCEPALFDEWIGRWSDLMDFEIIPLMGKKNYPGAAAIESGE